MFTRKRKALVTLAAFGLLTQVSGAYEVTTHQELTRQALRGEARAENLKFFIRAFDLEQTDYSDEGEIELYWVESFTNTLTASGSFVEVAEELTNHPDVRLNISLQGNYRGLIETGSILEDAATSLEGINVRNGRFLRHFYDVHVDGCAGLSTDGGLGRSTCSRDWGLNGGGDSLDNPFTFALARQFYTDSIKAETEDERRLAQANLFVTAGHLVHLLEDLTQPSHSRDDAHPGGGLATLSGGPTAIEPWASTNFRSGLFNRIRDINAFIASHPARNPMSYHDAFDSTARFAHDNFVSDDTIPGQLFDGGHGSPTSAQLREEAFFSANGNDYLYMESQGLDIPDGTPLAIHTAKALWRDSYDLTATIDDVVVDTVLVANVQTLFPESVAIAEGMINFMFRARILASPNADDANQLIVRNITDQAAVNSAIDTTIRSGATIEILYDTLNDTRIPLLPPITLDVDLPVGGEFLVDGFQDAIDSVSDQMLPSSQFIGDESRITVLVSGLMGGDTETEDWIVAGSTFNFVDNASVLFSFDRSGSMSQEIEDAKASGLTVVPILVGGSDNYAAVHSFSSSAGVDQSHTNDFSAVRSAIQGITSGGSTALFDAIVFAGEAASAEKTDRPGNKSIVILYTDGQENSSFATREQAIEAISSIDHPEIDVVYLVFLGSGGSGSSVLSDIAAQSGRRFLRLENVEQLTSEIISIIN